jgi:CHASE2 domain-containing sensor protein
MLDFLINSALAAHAANETRTPFSYDAVTYLWVIAWSTAGGFVSFMRKLREGTARAFNFTEFIGEMFTSAFVGVLTFLLCEWAGISPMLSACFIAITGHMGSRALFVAEKFAQTWAEKKVGVTLSDADSAKSVSDGAPKT